MKSSDKLKFNVDATALAEMIPGSMDSNHNFIVKDNIAESYISNSEMGFDALKSNVSYYFQLIII